MNNYVNVGLGNVSSFQTSARPFLTSSIDVPLSGTTPVKIAFENVTKFIVISNDLPTGGTNVPLRFGFSEAGTMGLVTNNYGLLNNGEKFQADVKVTAVFLLSDSATLGVTGSVIAGLTSIPFDPLAGNWTGSVGIG